MPSHRVRTLVQAALAASLLLTASPSRADLGGISTTARLPEHDRGGAILGVKVGVLLPQVFSPLTTSYYVEAEAGYILPWVRRLFAVTLSAGFTSPTTDGGGSDPRLPGGAYSYSVTQQQLILGFTVWGKIPLGRFVPYIGVGPRLFLLNTISTGQAGPGSDGQTVAIPQSTETSTEIGVGVPLGLDVLLGPGRLFGEAQLLWVNTGQKSTGLSSPGSIVIAAGYRFVL